MESSILNQASLGIFHRKHHFHRISPYKPSSYWDPPVSELEPSEEQSSWLLVWVQTTIPCGHCHGAVPRPRHRLEEIFARIEAQGHEISLFWGGNGWLLNQKGEYFTAKMLTTETKIWGIVHNKAIPQTSNKSADLRSRASGPAKHIEHHPRCGWEAIFSKPG